MKIKPVMPNLSWTPPKRHFSHFFRRSFWPSSESTPVLFRISWIVRKPCSYGCKMQFKSIFNDWSKKRPFSNHFWPFLIFSRLQVSSCKRKSTLKYHHIYSFCFCGLYRVRINHITVTRRNLTLQWPPLLIHTPQKGVSECHSRVYCSDNTTRS